MLRIKHYIIGILLTHTVFASSQSCEPPVINFFDNSTLFSTHVRWLDINEESAESYTLRYRPVDQSLGEELFIHQSNTNEVTLNNLLSGQDYILFIKANCNESESDWNGPYTFQTMIDNEQSCNLNLSIRDNGCPVESRFKMYVSGINDTQSLEYFSLIIDHDWPADLKLALTAPSGQSIDLVSHQGVFTQHFGNPEDESCTESTQFNDRACAPLTNGNSNLIGNFRPLDPMSLFNPPYNGVWELVLCDRASGDVGTIQHAELFFSNVTCQVPLITEISNITENSASISWDPSIGCNRVLLIYGPEGFDPMLGNAEYIECNQSNTFTLTNLSADTAYDFYLANECSEELISPLSCTFRFNTLCSAALHVSTFNDLDSCSLFCLNTCRLNTFWQNNLEDDLDWIPSIRSNNVRDNLPINGAFGFADFLTLQSPGQSCPSNGEGVLTSDCIVITQNAETCGMHFYTAIYGDDAQIELKIQNQETQELTSLMTISSTSDLMWNDQYLDLSDYIGQTIRIILTGRLDANPASSISIDQITLLEGADPFHPSITSYVDADGDGYGDSSQPRYGCNFSQSETNLSDVGGDCDDADFDINPGKIETPCNGIDENCNGLTDDVGKLSMEYVLTDFFSNTCLDDAIGLIEIEVIGGTPPYLIEWDNGESGNRIEGLTTGYYSATLTDALGCTSFTDEIEIFHTYSIPYTVLSLDDPSCHGIDNGSIELAVGLEEDSYSILWSNGDEELKVDNLSAGIYQATLEDNAGCRTIISPLELSPELEQLAAVQLISDVKCVGEETGEIRMQGLVNSPLRYSWSDGTEGEQRNQLHAGTYAVTISDQNSGCFQIIEDIHVSEPDSMHIVVDDIFQNTCHNDTEGAIFISVDGGTPPYAYKWSNAALEDDIINLPGGLYNLSITDSRGCQIVSDPIEIINPPRITIELLALDPTTCIDSEDGNITIETSGGSGNLSYQWNTNPLSFTQHLSDVKAGAYSVTAVDDLGCKATLRNILLDTEGLVLNSEATLQQSLVCAGDTTASIEVVVEAGSQPFDYNWSNGIKHITNSATDTLIALGAGIYDVTITDANGCTGLSNQVEIEEPNQITHTVESLEHIDCFGGNDGTIEISTQNATLPLEVQWSHGSMDSLSLSGLGPGEYSATIIDANGCMHRIDTLAITEPEVLSLSFEVFPETTSSLGSIQYIVTGGTANYTILIDEIKTPFTGNINDLANGDYLLTIQDNNGCVIDTVFNVPIVNSTSDESIALAQCFPNPVNTTVYFSVESTEQISYMVLDINGQTVLSGDHLPDSLEIDTVTDGIYVILLQSKTGKNQAIRINKISY